jgi:hypothetical protein
MFVPQYDKGTALTCGLIWKNEVKDKIEIHHLLPLWAFMACSWVNFTFAFTTLRLLSRIETQDPHVPTGSEEAAIRATNFSSKLSTYKKHGC